MVFKSIISAVCTCLAVVSLNVNALPSYDVDVSGNITGISGLEVQGETWDMTLHSGSYGSIFSNYPEAGRYEVGFAYSAESAAVDFINSQLIPELSRFLGCASPDICLIGTAIEQDPSWYDENPQRELAMFLGIEKLLAFSPADAIVIDWDADAADTTWASWARPADVPEPSIAILMASGLIVIGAVRRKSRV